MIRIEKNGPVSTIIIDRPHAKNAVDGPTARALAEAFMAFEQDDEAKVAVFYGDGGFCAGADLKAVATMDGSNPMVDPAPIKGETVSLDDTGPMGPSRLLLSKPVIAAIEGHAVAGGMELALWCDMRVMEEDAVFGVFCRRWGVPLIDGGTQRLPRLIGLSRAMDLILTGRPVDAEESLQMGLANRVVAKGTVREEAEQLALSISQFPQECLRADRLSAYQAFDGSIEEGLTLEFSRGRPVVDLGLASSGAARFASGKGRGGDFSDI
ncbi:crotonase/enoyl-CoA hydratase family protein [uncultured Pseudoteredinibacter sp.]|uniref:crotonase/enoyl-CoA hydratase family protein n=1 Tax=uncultured Pseudoteredinibacter sp. TaxID=1641701 RepID=UPI0026216ECF|nr:crotonase/enoyl-CoA hydratase family protein [uncultured Pseudoteredinibacter sp.]